MYMKHQDILDDPSFRKYAKKKNISERTMGNYIFSLIQFCNANNKRLDDIVQEVIEEQYPFMDQDGRIHEYNPEFSRIDNYLYSTVVYLQNKGNSNHSVYAHITRIRAVLNALNIKLPKMVELEKDPKDWYVLSKDDIKFVISISPLHHQALISFLSCTGLRIGDAMNLTIDSFMKATFPCHNCTEVDAFLEKAPEGMMGYWQLIPQKTRKHQVQCKVYNTPESSDLLLKSLHRRMESIEKLNEKNGTNLKLEKGDALFSSRNKSFKGKLNHSTITTLFNRRNQELLKYKKRLLKQELDKGEISEETFRIKVSQIPIFHAHGLRKFFITTLARKRVDLRASAFLEGHRPLMDHDRSYVDSDDLEEMIYNEYLKVAPSLCFAKDEEDLELGKRNHELKMENAELKEYARQLEIEKLNIKKEFKMEAKRLLEDLLKEKNIRL